MSTSYKVEYWVVDKERASLHFVNELQERLNAYASEGWRLKHMFPVTTGYALVLEKDESWVS